MRSFPLQWTLVLLAGGGLGCTLPGKARPTASIPAGTVQVTYQTGSDRLTGAKQPIQPVAYQPEGIALPPQCTATLHVVNAPDQASGTARAMLVVQHAENALREVWVLDIPRQQLDAVTQRLKDDNFFRRSKSEASEVFVAARVDTVKIGKEFHPVAELDALILQVRNQGQRLAGGLAAANPLPAVISVARGPSDVRRN